MKPILSFLLVIVFCVKSSAEITLSQYLQANFWLGYYERHPSEIPSDLSTCKKLISVNLGYDNARKYALLLRHFQGKNDKSGFCNTCDQSLADGVFARSIDSMAAAYPDYYSRYRTARHKAIRSVDFELLKKLKKINEDDQLFRTSDRGVFDSNFKQARAIDEQNNSLLLEQTKKYGWLWCYRFDTAASYRDMRSVYDLFSIVSHFQRSEIEVFRDLAITYASQNKISWGEVIVLNQLLYWKWPLYWTRETGKIFPLGSIHIRKNGKIDFTQSFLELYTIGNVVMGGLKNMRVTIYPTEKMKKEFPGTFRNQLATCRRYLVVYGANAKNIQIRTKPEYVLPPLSQYYMYYRIEGSPSGSLRLPSPYALLVMY